MYNILSPAKWQGLVFYYRGGKSMELRELCQRAKAAKYEVQNLSTDKKNDALLFVAKELTANSDKIIKANAIDVKKGQENGMHHGLVDRLLLDEKRIEAMALGIRQVAELPDPIGEVTEEFERPNGLKLKKVRVPLGVIGIIYESRPNVTADAFALTFKAGNAVILKGGSDAINSNIAIAEVIRDALEKKGITRDAVLLIKDTDRAVTSQFMKMNEYVDVLIPRGSAGLIRAVVENSTIPVIETGSGNCHIYVDKDADPGKAVPIIINAKTQRIGVCNAAESLVVHEDIRDEFLPLFSKAMKENKVEVRADEGSKAYIDGAKDATFEDFGKEYLDYIISVKTVKDVDEAIAHINRYNTGHSEAIITEDTATAQRFLDRVDAACVYVNASTRFTDGFEFGFGAEIGISTQKLHARGPMGLRELTSYKYQIYGEGQIRK
jgi:glutamate-5-semialdehyde dehydrogenase